MRCSTAIAIPVRARGTRRARPRRPRSAPASAPRSRIRCWSSWPGFASARASRFSGLRTIQPKISVEAADGDELRAEPRGPARRAQAQRAASVLPIAVVDEQRAEQVRAAAVVLLRRALPLLVAADRDVLGAVVGGDVRAAQRESGRREREQAADELLRRRADRSASRAAPSRPSHCRASPRARRGAGTGASPRAAHAGSAG